MECDELLVGVGLAYQEPSMRIKEDRSKEVTTGTPDTFTDDALL
jgi:hypothetical protein